MARCSNFEQWMNANTSKTHKIAFFHPSFFSKILVLVLEHLFGVDFKDFALKIFYNSKVIERSSLKKIVFKFLKKMT